MKYCKQCNAEITHNKKRRLCTECLKEEQRQNYNFKKEIYNKNRKEKRKQNKVLDTRFCVICKAEFQTAHAIKCTCNDECSETHRRKLSLDNYYSKKAKNAK